MEKTAIELAYGITQIKTKSIAIQEPDGYALDDIDVIGQVGLEINVETDFTVDITFEIASDFIDKKTGEKLVAHIGITKYKLVHAEAIISKEDMTLKMPDQLMVTLYSMAHTHARALLATELKNTIFKDQLFIPIIDPKSILNHKPNSEL